MKWVELESNTMKNCPIHICRFFFSFSAQTIISRADRHPPPTHTHTLPGVVTVRELPMYMGTAAFTSQLYMYLMMSRCGSCDSQCTSAYRCSFTMLIFGFGFILLQISARLLFCDRTTSSIDTQRCSLRLDS